MTAPVMPTTSASAGSSNPTQGGSGTDMFLQLLIAEVSHQDPLNAMDPSEMVSQLAQMTSVDEMVQSTETTQLSAALALVGRGVTVLSPQTGAPTQGTVSGVQMSQTGPMLVVGGQTVPFGNLVSVP
jgi:flagellar basal-body rod modification protein FlgD